jgi:hypothetical protein
MISRVWRCFTWGRKKLSEEPEIKPSNMLAELKRLNQPTEACAHGVLNLTDTVLPAYFPPQFESRAIECD